MVKCELCYSENVVLVFQRVKYFVLVSAMNEDDLVLYVSAWTVAWFFFGGKLL